MKITKKIVALTLSLLMVCGCIPNFSNEANAEPADVWNELVNKVDLETYTSDAFTIKTIDGIVTIALNEDITASSNHSPISFNGTKNYKLKLNGHILNANNNEAINDGNVIWVGEGASLTIVGPGTITGGNNTGDGGAIYCEGTLTLNNNVTIKECKAKNGGAIYFDGRIETRTVVDAPDQYVYHNLTINQVLIEDCYASENGAGIWGKSVLSLTNLYIKECEAQGNGGGIYLAENTKYGADQPDKCSRAEIGYGSYVINIDACEAKNGSAIYVEEDSVCTLSNNVSIKNCIATEKGTIYSKGVLGIETAEISSNKAPLGGGVYLEGNAFLGKDAKIIENSNGSTRANNLYLTNAGKIIFGSGSDVPKPTSNMKISLSLETLPTEGNPITLFENGLTDYANYIKLDNNSPDDPNRLYIIYDGSKFVAYTDEVLPAPKTSSSPKKYTISKSEASHGDYELSNIRATKGTKVYLKLYPEKGFTVETISIYDNNGNAIEIKNEEKNKYSFTMPKGNIDVDVTFMEDNSMLNFCTDVKAKDECYDAVKWAYENNITTGVNSVTFGKEITVTRAQVATLLYRAAGAPEVTNETSKQEFNDVKEGDYFEDAVKWAANNNITQGTGDNNFEPNKACTNGEIVVMLSRAENILNKTNPGLLDSALEQAINTTQEVYNNQMENYFNNYANQMAMYEKLMNETSNVNNECTRETAVELLFIQCGSEEFKLKNK